MRVRSYLVEREHVTRDVPLGESRSSIREEIPPLPLERLERGRICKPRVPFRHRLHRHVGLQSPTPLSERPRVVASVVLDGLDREPVLGRFRRGVDQRRGARQCGVWPHVSAHKVFRLVRLVPGFGEGRGGDDGGGVLVLQSPVDELEVGLVMLSAHVLEVPRVSLVKRQGREPATDFDHLHAHEGVEATLPFDGQISVIHQVDPDSILKSSCPDPFLRQSFLLDR